MRCVGIIPGAPGMPGTIGIGCIPGMGIPRPKGAMPRGTIPGIKPGNGFIVLPTENEQMLQGWDIDSWGILGFVSCIKLNN